MPLDYHRGCRPYCQAIGSTTKTTSNMWPTLIKFAILLIAINDVDDDDEYSQFEFEVVWGARANEQSNAIMHCAEIECRCEYYLVGRHHLMNRVKASDMHGNNSLQLLLIAAYC